MAFDEDDFEEEEEETPTQVDDPGVDPYAKAE